MKYKTGDKVKIRTWKNMEKEYGLNEHGDICYNMNSFIFIFAMEEFINKKCHDRIITIAQITKKFGIDCYKLQGNKYWHFEDWIIESLAKKPKPILTRWEILDL